jgi:hypothetical protein
MTAVVLSHQMKQHKERIAIDELDAYFAKKFEF